MKARKAEHAPHGDPCGRCGLPALRHREPRSRVDSRKRSERDTFIGIDGEGQGTAPHRYVFLAACDETGAKKWCVRNPAGLTTVECLDFILSLPAAHTKLFAYSFNYDLTKILRDVDDMRLYKLFRPELRKGEKGPKPVFWNGYSLNLLNTRFTVKRITSAPGVVPAQFGPAHTIHDIWRFFQGKFTTALEDWKIGTVAQLDRMREMKSKRGGSAWAKESPAALEAYCFEECQFMGELARRLTDAHEKAGLQLKNYFGAGSSASAMLKAMGVKEHIEQARKANPVPDEMQEAVASAFFGGRFENSVIGSVKGPVYSYDISSAYPYQLCFLPCLVHGKWTKTKNRKAAFAARTALVRYRLDEPANPRIGKDWAPFPFRLADGTITYPRASGGGWIWRDEFLAGEKLFPNARFVEAWAYGCDCSCQPFAGIADYYRERVRIGKEGPGIVIKLGVNSCYGKTAQSVGGLGPYTSWVWAGLITSGCRAQILEALGMLKKRSSLLMVATDGICTTEPLAFPEPRDTGTSDVVNAKGERKPLGGWEAETLPDGLFLARPGIYFAPHPTAEKMKKVRGRGVGRAAVVDHWRQIIDAYEAGEPSILVAKLSRFIGAKTGITRSGKEGAYRYKRSPQFGEWIVRPVQMGFSPLPKREGVAKGGRLGLRAFPQLVSTPYRPGLVSPEALALKLMTIEALEQPDGGDLVDFDAVAE